MVLHRDQDCVGHRAGRTETAQQAGRTGDDLRPHGAEGPEASP
jgi:hypothetical protein